MRDNISKTILLVEDDEVMQRIMKMALERSAFKCIVASSVEEALSILKRKAPDLILSDYELPITNGFAFREMVMKHKTWKDIPFVFMTSHSEEAMMLQGLNMNAVDYIVKGTPIPVVISKLNNIIESLRAAQERAVAELKTAAEYLNIKCIPEKSPDLKGFKIRFWNKSYQSYMGGDFIDFIKLDERFCFVILGDIMGKKWKAWFFTFGYLSYIRSVIRFCVLNQDTSAEIMQRINHLVCLDESLQGILSTMSLLLVDTHTGNVSYTGAGDLPLVHYIKNTNTVTTIASEGIVLGLQEKGFYEEQILHLQKGDQLLAFTDGLIDIIATDAKKSDYDYFLGNIKHTLGQHNSFELIDTEVLQQINSYNQLDDASIIFIERN